MASKFQERYEDYLHHASTSSSSELAHFGVPGMKWGVRKGTYKSLNRRQRKALKGYSVRAQVSAAAKQTGRNSNYVKQTGAYKKRLEKALGTKINDESSKGSFKNSSLLRGLVGGIPLSGVTQVVRANRANKQANMSQKELSEYLGKKKKK